MRKIYPEKDITKRENFVRSAQGTHTSRRI